MSVGVGCSDSKVLLQLVTLSTQLYSAAQGALNQSCGVKIRDVVLASRLRTHKSRVQ